MRACVTGFRKDLLFWTRAVVLPCGNCSSFSKLSRFPRNVTEDSSFLLLSNIQHNLYEGVRCGLKVTYKRLIEQLIKLQLLRS